MVYYTSKIEDAVKYCEVRHIERGCVEDHHYLFLIELENPGLIFDTVYTNGSDHKVRFISKDPNISIDNGLNYWTTPIYNGHIKPCLQFIIPVISQSRFQRIEV